MGILSKLSKINVKVVDIKDDYYTLSEQYALVGAISKNYCN
jgi:hypothetical protein